MKITKFFACQILDSRGMPTIESTVSLSDNSVHRASVPAGASRGSYEACELRDGDENYFFGKGVKKAITLIHEEIAPYLLGKEPDIRNIDAFLQALDTTQRKERLGANTTLAVSSVVLKAHAHKEGKEVYELVSILSQRKSSLPSCLFNIINGGKHAAGGLTLQEFSVIPCGFPSFDVTIAAVVKVYYTLKDLCVRAGYPSCCGDEGGLVLFLKERGVARERKALDFLMDAIENAGFIPGKDFSLGLDSAAGTFYDHTSGLYIIAGEKYSKNDLLGVYDDLLSDYPIIILEDPFVEHDQESWKRLSSRQSTRSIIGDDIFATQRLRLEEGFRNGVAHGSIIKPNQVGTITQALDAVQVCSSFDKTIVVSHRSGETTDSLIADIAVGVGAHFLKAGAPIRGERVAKYNRLLSIASTLER